MPVKAQVHTNPPCPEYCDTAVDNCRNACQNSRNTTESAAISLADFFFDMCSTQACRDGVMQTLAEALADAETAYNNCIVDCYAITYNNCCANANQ
ncbi:MAG: hypothetical protein J0L93_08650 [Deltaproteobacteria bacterium]|nr:hypothetical protein [Deltaproteobacteria bacterium]